MNTWSSSSAVWPIESSVMVSLTTSEETLKPQSQVYTSFRAQVVSSACAANGVLDGAVRLARQPEPMGLRPEVAIRSAIASTNAGGENKPGQSS